MTRRKPPAPPGFARSPRRRNKPRNTTDAVGSVVVWISLRDPDDPRRTKKGNMSRAFTVKDARVSDVYTAIERALFSEETAPGG